ncbi:MAG: LysR family transcriptional regulator [Alphaproteobacteria bacterium]|nr:MAG: LysR family transcriptional regulator [Alphaproteobacteria bacterium]
MRNYFDYDTAEAVYYVYLYESTTKAAEKINLSQPAVSRRILAAEERTGIVIFERNFHRMIPTKEGMTYIEACKKILHIGDAALKDAHAQAQTDNNEIRILSTPSMAATWLPFALQGFSKKHPDLLVRIRSSANPLDVLESDVLISPYLSDKHHVAKEKLYDSYQGLFCSQQYLDNMQTVPHDLDDLENYHLLTIDEKRYERHITANWLLTVGISDGRKMRQASLELDSNDGRYQAMLNHHGIAPIAIQHIRMCKPKGVVRILPDIRSDPKSVYFFYNSHQKELTNHRILLDFLRKHITDHPDIYQNAF